MSESELLKKNRLSGWFQMTGLKERYLFSCRDTKLFYNLLPCRFDIGKKIRFGLTQLTGVSQ